MKDRQRIDGCSGTMEPWLPMPVAIYRKTLALVFLLSQATAFVESTTAVATLQPLDEDGAKCDRTFVSSEGSKNGTFSAPFMINHQNYSRQCIYTFIATEDERVQITFTHFALRGAKPMCNHEYIDLYMEIEDPSVELIRTPFGGRICGRNIPVSRISMYETLVLAFYTDRTRVTPQLFGGTYEFIDAAQYVMGTPTPNTVCSYTVYSDQKREGDMMSPTYPGVYPKNLRCSYNFFGKRGQRLRLEFMDFDLLYGGPHCPFDFVKIYDGESEEYPLINTYCGQQRNLVVFSSSENLYVKFVTLQRNADNSNRGFKAAYEFSERFVSLDFISKTDGEHIRGTQCDQKILSKRGSSGLVCSPNYPYPYHPDVICRYYIYGMQDAQRLERVRLKFEKFEIPSTTPTCTEGFLRIYLQGQEERYALDEFDHNLCGQDLPPSLKSEGPRLVMIFKSGSTQGQGFKAQYHFEADYQVPGTASPNGSCQFFYRSESQKFGDFNSPHYPANYPSSIQCEYYFLGLQGEQVNLVFNYFKTKMDVEAYGYNEICQEDWLEIYEVWPSGRERKLGRYCGRTAPGPIMSALGVDTVKVLLHTDDKNVASGFTATYEFFPADTRYVDCGRNISELTEGVLLSPGFPGSYSPSLQVCNWFITVRPHHRILLSFVFFQIEGDPERRGCPGAVVRVYPELSEPPMELCGESLANHSREILSSSNIMKISFVTADKAVGAKGFQATWTEIKEGTKCDQFQCSTSKYCVAESAKCNSLPNCGLDDYSDEVDCLAIHGIDIHLIIGLSFGGAIITVITMCAIFHRKCKRRRTPSDTQHHRNQPKMAATPHIAIQDHV
ncbi:cubilin-like isoform X1 [Argiope bruennichi]|uniref:cubilin-like isoform X1 n=2 Tax=Argiope bruennichi TaxID=94029 RepID=UPI002495744A|nr:cubilin-like isoform X1 [Argiope bruennichi]